MNAFVILLDPRLHTIDYVRRTSTCLFTSILAVSSKFLRPTLFPALLTSARQLVGRAIIDGNFSVGLIQSILLGTYYKQPSDCSSWFRIGLAIRMGAFFFLPSREMTSDVLKCRFSSRSQPTSFIFMSSETILCLKTSLKLGKSSTAREFGSCSVYVRFVAFLFTSSLPPLSTGR